MKLACAAVVALGSVASFGSFVAPPAGAQSSVIDIGTLGTGGSYLWSVNNRGDAVGWSELIGSDSEHAVLWRDGALIDLGALPDFPASRALDINERGQIVGAALNFSLARARALLWSDGRAVDITPTVNASCFAMAIDNRGDIAGSCDSVAVVWRRGTVAPLPTLPGTRLGGAADMNDAGVIVGTLNTPAGDQVPVRWTHGEPTALPLPPGALGGVASAVNARGQITGYVILPGTYEPVLWEGDQVRPLAGAWGALFGFGYGINNRGDVALHAFTWGTFEFGAYVWRDGRFSRLEPTGVINDINEPGVVVGRIFVEGGDGVHGAIWPKAAIPSRGVP